MTSTTIMRLLTITLVTALLAAPLVSSQVVTDAPSAAGANMHFTYWSIETDSVDETMSQFAVPISGFIPLARDFEARFYLGNSMNSLESEVNETTSDLSTSGMTDLRLQLSHSFFEDVLLLSAGIGLPTGKTELDFEGREIINRLSSNYLVFPVRRFGQGLDLSFQAATARQFETVEIGASMSLDITGEYDPYEGITGYNPGDAFNLAGGLTLFNERNSAGMTIAYTSFGNDQLDGVDVFKQADYIVLSFDFMYQNRAKDVRLKPYIAYVARSENKRYSDDAQQVESELKIYGDEFTAMVQLESDVSPTVTAGPTLMYRWIGENDEEFGSSSLLGVGGNIHAALGRNVGLTLAGTFYSGEADDGAIDLTGLQTSLGLTAIF